MTNEEIQKAIKCAGELAIEAGEKLMPHFGNIEAESKSTTGYEASDVVTKLDREIETFLCNELAKSFPEIGFRGEEHGIVREGDTFWINDPIDGTAHFVRGLPFCSTMLALIENGRVVGSVIYRFTTDDMYHAVRGDGAYKNNERIHVGDRPLKDALVSFETNMINPKNYACYQKVKAPVGGTIATVSSGYEFAMIAEGKIDGRIVVDGFGQDWDFAPGTLLVEEAGAIVKNIDSEDYDYTNHDFVAANPSIADKLLRILSE